jgi:hypothetical protein
MSTLLTMSVSGVLRQQLSNMLTCSSGASGVRSHSKGISEVELARTLIDGLTHENPEGHSSKPKLMRYVESS